jgi:hypothetical protein
MVEISPFIFLVYCCILFTLLFFGTKVTQYNEVAQMLRYGVLARLIAAPWKEVGWQSESMQHHWCFVAEVKNVTMVECGATEGRSVDVDKCDAVDVCGVDE